MEFMFMFMFTIHNNMQNLIFFKNNFEASHCVKCACNHVFAMIQTRQCSRLEWYPSELCNSYWMLAYVLSACVPACVPACAALCLLLAAHRDELHPVIMCVRAHHRRRRSRRRCSRDAVRMLIAAS